MANRKIGAFIALDGEKRFRQDVTSCNKTLTTLKSEMSLVKAESEGQANSLESLRKKHEVLNKTLDAHKQKEEAVQRALDHARESYEKVGLGLTALTKDQETHQRKIEELQEEYQSACDRLEAMTKAGNSSEQSMKKQEAVVNLLSQELKKEEESLAEVNTALAKGEKNYQSAGNRVKDWETKLNTAQAQTIKATRALNENAAYMREAEQATDQCATSIDEFGKKTQDAMNVTMEFGSVLRNNLYNTLIDLAKDGLQQVKETMLSTESSMRQLQASTGLTTEEMKEYKASMDALYTNNYGEDLEDIAKSMALVKQYTNGIQPSIIEEMTENGIAMRDVFDMDLSETIRGVSAMMDNMGTDSQTAFDLMAKGAQNGLNKSGELTDNIAEYGPLWAQAGFSAQEMFAIMQNGLDAGAYNLDKVNDFVKEFGNSLADGRIEASLDSFSDETGMLFYQWKAGKATTRDVFYSVINDLNSATNKQQMLTLASNTWSALGEDNALKVITSLGKVNNAYDDVEGTMEEIKDIKYDTLESRIQQLGRTVLSDLAKPVAEDALPAIEKGLDIVIENTDKLIPLTKVAVAGLVTYKTASVAITAYKTAAEMATAQQELLNIAMNANPAALIAIGVMAAGTALVLFSDHAKAANEETLKLIDESKVLTEETNTLSQEMQQAKAGWKETTASMEAQKSAANNLTDELFALQGQEEKTAVEKQRMKAVVGELNTLFPELSLTINEETGELNQNREAIEKSIKASLEYNKAKAAEEELSEISRKLADAELKKYEIEKKNEEIAERLKEVQKERNELGETGAAIIDEYGRSFDNASEKEKQLIAEEAELKKQLDENQESINNLQTNYEDLNTTYSTVEEYMQKQIDKSEEMSDAYWSTSEFATESANAQQAAAEATASKIAETYTGMQQTISETLDSQMNMFEKFDAGTELSTSKLLKNMQSQIDGVSNWADNLATLADRGINQNLLTYLSELGPEGAGYVATFASMSDEELKKANDMWQQSLDMKEGVNESVQGMLESYTNALNGGKDQVAQVATQIADGTVQGLVNEMNARRGEAGTAGEGLGETATDGVATGAGTHSPSRKTMETGKNVVQGLVLGIRNATSLAETAASNMAKNVTKRIDTDLQTSKFTKTGKNITSGLINGIRSGQPMVISATTSLSTAIQNNINSKITLIQFASAGKRIPDGLASGMNAGRGTALSAAASLANSVHSRAANIGSLYSTGLNLSQGMASGILAGRSAVVNATANVCAAAVQKARADLKINSPSKVFEEIGRYMAEGQGIGYEKGSEQLNAIIAESMELPETKTHDKNSFNMRELGIGELSYKDIEKMLGGTLEKAFGKALKKVELAVYLDGRKVDRTLRDRGVVYA